MNKKQMIKRTIASVIVLLLCFYAKAAECEIDGIVFDYEYSIEYDKEDSHTYTLLSASVKVKDGKSLTGAVVIPSYITVDDGVRLMVTAIGASAFEGNTSITKVNIPGGVSHIYGSAFKNCTALEDVIIGTPSEGMPSDGLTYIEDYAFENCTSLKSIDLPNSLLRIGNIGGSSFGGCTSLSSIILPTNLKSIAQYTFNGCTNLKTVTVNCSFTSIGDYAFQHCEALTSIDLSNGIEEIGEYAFNSCYNMKSIKFPAEGFTTIGYSCFRLCTSLESITIPGCVRSIGDYCCQGCTGLKTAIIELGEKISLRDYLFDGCTNLIQANISSYNTLLSNSFRGCTNLKTVVLNNMTEISSLFENCTSLESVSIPNTVKTINSKAFKNCSALENISIPSSVTTIYGEAFMGCSGLKSIAIPDGVTALPKSVFEGCSSLESISLPSTLTEIGNKSLWGCSSLTKLDIPSQLKTVRNSAFVSCKKISTLIFPATLTTLEPNAFYGCKGLKLIDLRLAQVKITNTSRDSNNSNLVFRDVPESTLILMPGETFTISDPEAKSVCLENWDTDGNGELSAVECMAVTDLNNVFKNNKTIKTFDELKYFTGLKSIKYGDFDGCTSLESIILPEGLEEIGDAPFGNCNALKSIIIPASVTKIGTANIGTYLWNLESIKVEEGNTVYDSRYNCNAIIEKASGKLIVGCQSTVIPNDVTTIAAWAFNTCLEKPIEIPESVTTIEKNAFLGNHFKTIVLPSSLTSMTWAFQDCSLKMVESRIMNPFALDELTFNMAENAVLYVPQGTKDLYEGTEGWNKFAAIIEVEPETSDNVINFENEKVKQLCLENWDLNSSGEISFNEAEGILNLERVFYTSGITSFKELQYFTKLKSIGEYAFRESGLTDIVLPQSVKSIEHGAFLGCNMTEIDIPASVASIGENAFLRCNKLASLRVNWKIPIAIEEKAFPTRANVVLHVPLGCKAAYEAADVWKDFKEITDDYTEGGTTFASKEDGTLMLSNMDESSTEVVIPSTLTVDGQEYSVTGISDGAFENNETLETVSIPGSIEKIGENAFAGCTNLQTIYNYGEDPADLTGTVKALTRSGEEISVAAKVFAEVDLETCKLYVPAGCSQKYKAAEGWNEFQNIIEMIKGDANGDKAVNAADVVEAINAMNNQPSANFIEFNADIDGNGKITDSDIQSISNFIMGIKISGKALSEATNEDVGSVIASDGNVYPAGTIGIAPIAMIVYVGEPGTADKNSSTYRGLAIALSDNGIYTEYDQKKSGPYNIVVDVQGDLNGLSCPWNKPEREAPEGTSGWFIPSSGQFYLFLKSLGMERHDDYENFEKNRFDLPYYISKDTESEYGYLDEPVYNIVNMLRKAGDLSVDFDYTGQLFWSCTYNGGNGRNYYLSFNQGGVKITYGAADAKARFRPFLAF